MRICLLHPHRVTREMLIRAIASKVAAEIVEFRSFEELFASSMDYDVFVLYNIFGREQMDRWEGVKWIREMKPQALILTMIHIRFFDRKFAPPSADALHLKVGDEIKEMVRVIQSGAPGKSFILVSGHISDSERA